MSKNRTQSVRSHSKHESIEVSSNGPMYIDKDSDNNGDDLLVGFDSDRMNRSKKVSQEHIHIDNKKTGKKDETLRPSLEPYFGRLEKFELFSTHQAYYLVGCDKHKNSYRFLRMDRTLIEHSPPRRAFNNYDTYYNSIHRSPSSYHSPDNHNFHDSSQPVSHSITSTSTDDQSSSFQENTSINVTINNNVTRNTDINPHQSQSNQSMSSSMHLNNPNNGYYPRQTNSNHFSSQPQIPPTPTYTPNHYNQYSNQQPYGHHSQYGQYPNQHYNSPQKSSYRRLPDFCIEDPYVYSEEEIQQVLDMIHDGNKHVGGLRPIVKAYGIVGFITFLDCYYLTLITKRTKVGQIGSNGIYSIKATETFPLKPTERGGNNEDSNVNPGDPSSMLLNMWNRGKRAAGLGLTQREIAELRYQGLYQVVDLTKNFFFSYTYDMTRSVQQNFLSMTAQTFPPPPFKDMYAWNFFLTRELVQCTSNLTSTYWVLPIVHGAFIQRKISDYGRVLNLSLLARRSRHFAGTRYLKRGVSDRGKVANDVEHEQILHDEASTGTFSSFLQMRGSIPTYWTQESSVTMPKPPIVLNRVDPTYRATQLHFEDLLKRYSSPIVVVDLVKQSEKREREVIVGNEYRHAIDYLNSYIDDKHKIRYCALDYSHISKHRNLNVSSSLNEVAIWSVNQTGFFCSNPRWKICENEDIEPYESPENTDLLSKHLGFPVFPMEQKGVLRTNCIDCLDRTNVAQFSAGVASLAQQLVVMGIRSSIKLDPTSNIVRVLIDMYVEIGDHIALQYGGSEAHKKVATAQVAAKEGPSAGKHKELLTSIRRYYSNTFTDRLKQDAMNLFLGYYVPHLHPVHLWDMESDYYLHNFHVKASEESLISVKSYEQAFAVDWSDDEEHKEKGQSTPPQRQTKTIDHYHRKVLSGADSTVDIFSKADVDNKINLITKRCKSQNKALSIWWKAAIHANIRERMWMKLNNKSPEALVTPRFERLYQPEKLAQFDKYFSRNFATPLRLSHSAQHAQSSDDTKEVIRCAVSRTKDVNVTKNNKELNHMEVESDTDESTCSEESNYSIIDLLKDHGFTSPNDQSLKNFISYYERKSQADELLSEQHDEESKDFMKSHFLNCQKIITNRSQYTAYVNYEKDHDYSFRNFRSGAREEFAKCLHENNLESDDVEGIRKLAESAHISSKIRDGPFRGLPQNESASKVTAVIHGYYNSSLNSQQPTQDASQMLKRNNVDTTGVKHELLNGWDHIIQSKNVYNELSNYSNMACRRSDLTTERSMKLYTSFYDGDSQLTHFERMFILGNEARKHKKDKKHPKKKIEDIKDTRNQAHSPKKNLKSSETKDDTKGNDTLLTSKHTYRARAGFEQINEDLYARKDNKFIVLNGVGVDMWRGTKPVTKLTGFLDLFSSFFVK